MSEVESKEELEALEAELMGEGEGFGSGANNDNQSQSQTQSKGEFLGADACGGLCGTIFDLVASRNGEKWRLKPDESQALGSALDLVLAKHIPNGIDEYGAEAALLLIAVGIVLPRMGGDDGAT